MPTINIGLMDFGYRSDHINSMEKLQDCLEYAMLAETLGFDKFWIGEHHMPQKALPWNDPTPIVPLLATHTVHISIGTTGILMCLHNPYHVVSSYKLYSNLFPGRIELGFANGTPYSGVAQQAQGQSNLTLVQGFEEKVRKTISFFQEEEALFKSSGVVFPPYKGLLPSLWTLSASSAGIARALAYGTHVSFWVTETFDPALRDRIQEYKATFFERYQHVPQLRAVLFGICHQTTGQAKRIADRQQEKITPMYGTAEKFEDFIHRSAAYYGIQDFMYFNSIRDPKERRIGIEALSDAFSLHTRRVDSSAATAPVSS